MRELVEQLTAKFEAEGKEKGLMFPQSYAIGCLETNFAIFLEKMNTLHLFSSRESILEYIQDEITKLKNQ